MANTAGPKDIIDWSKKAEFQRIFTKQAVQSYIFLSFGMGIVALSLPIALVLAQGYHGIYSISYYYHAGELPRNIMVGCLWATGVFLFLFHGLSKTENWILNVAGVAAISIAMNPMGAQCPQDAKLHFSLHAASAITFFICLAIVAVGFSKGRTRYILWPPKRRLFDIAYNLAGAAMILMPAGVALIHFSHPGKCPEQQSHWIFWIECFGIWAFSFFWFVKTLEYRMLLGVRWHPSPGLHMLWEQSASSAWPDEPQD